MKPEQFTRLIHDLRELAVKHNITFIWQNQRADGGTFGSILIPLKSEPTGRTIRVMVSKGRGE